MGPDGHPGGRTLRRKTGYASRSLDPGSAPPPRNPSRHAMIPALMAQAGLGETLQNEPIAAVATLFLAGLATSLTPCVYPMIPITAGIIAGGSGEKPSRFRTVTLT